MKMLLRKCSWLSCSTSIILAPSISLLALLLLHILLLVTHVHSRINRVRHIHTHICHIACHTSFSWLSWLLYGLSRLHCRWHRWHLLRISIVLLVLWSHHHVRIPIVVDRRVWWLLCPCFLFWFWLILTIVFRSHMRWWHTVVEIRRRVHHHVRRRRHISAVGHSSIRRGRSIFHHRIWLWMHIHRVIGRRHWHAWWILRIVWTRNLTRLSYIFVLSRLLIKWKSWWKLLCLLSITSWHHIALFHIFILLLANFLYIFSFLCPLNAFFLFSLIPSSNSITIYLIFQILT